MLVDIHIECILINDDENHIFYCFFFQIPVYTHRNASDFSVCPLKSELNLTPNYFFTYILTSPAMN